MNELSERIVKREDPRFGGNRLIKLQTNWGIDNGLWRSREELIAFKRALIAYLPTDPVHSWRQDPTEHVRYQLANAMSNEDDAKAFIFDFWSKYSPEIGIRVPEAPWKSMSDEIQIMFLDWINEDPIWHWQRRSIPNWLDKVLEQPTSRHCFEVWQMWLSYCSDGMLYAEACSAQLAQRQAQRLEIAAISQPSDREQADIENLIKAFTRQVEEYKTPVQARVAAYWLVNPDLEKEIRELEDAERWAKHLAYEVAHPVMPNGRQYDVPLDQYCIVDLPTGGRACVQLNDPAYADVSEDDIAYYSTDCQLIPGIPDHKIARLKQQTNDIVNYQKILDTLELEQQNKAASR
jgi:hypothetical protein